MNEFYGTLVTPFFAFFAIMSPLTNAPVFLGLTSDLPESERPAVAIRGVLVAFVTVAAFVFGGTALLEMFGIDIAAVRAFGGLVVVRVGFDLITKSAASSHKPMEQTTSAGLGVAISPLAIPILAGPGTLSTALGLSADEGELGRLGEDFISATTKVMGIVLGAIGTQMVIDGVLALARG